MLRQQEAEMHTERSRQPFLHPAFPHPENGQQKQQENTLYKTVCTLGLGISVFPGGWRRQQ